MMPATSESTQQAAAVLERVFKGQPFKHGAPEHPQFLNDVRISNIEIDYSASNCEKGLASHGETILLTVADPHLRNAPKATDDFLIARLSTDELGIKSALATEPGSIKVSKFHEGKPSKDDTTYIEIKLQPTVKAQDIIANIAALNGKQQHAHPELQFATVNSVKVVGTAPVVTEEKFVELQKYVDGLFPNNSKPAQNVASLTPLEQSLVPAAEEILRNVQAGNVQEAKSVMNRAVAYANQQAPSPQLPLVTQAKALKPCCQQHSVV